MLNQINKEIKDLKNFFLKNFFLSYFFIVLFFPFFLKIKIQNFEFSIKYFLIFCFLFFLLYLKKILSNDEKKIIKKIFVILSVCYLLSFIYFYYNFLTSESFTYISQNDKNFYFQRFYNLILKSIFTTFGVTSFYFIFIKFLNQNNILIILKIFYFFCLLIFFEFILHFLLKKYLGDIELINRIYNEKVFRSILLNGHIVTSIFLGTGYFIGIYLSKILKTKNYFYFSFTFFLIILYNFETRLTLLSFLYLILVQIFCTLFNKTSINLKINIILYLSIILIIFLFSKINTNNIYEISFLNFNIITDSLFDRLNISIVMFFAFLNFPFGYGFEMVGSYLHFLYIPNIHFGNFDFQELYGSFLTIKQLDFLEFHRDFPRSHNGLLNIITSFGLFLIPIYHYINRYNKFQVKIKYNVIFEVFCKYLILFIIFCSFLNYTFDIELLSIFILTLYLKMKTENEKK